MTEDIQTDKLKPVIDGWSIPTDTDSDKLHIHIQLSKVNDFSDIEFEKESYNDQSGFEYNDGSWTPFPSNGVPSSAYGNSARYILQSSEELDPDWYYFRLRAYDGYEYGSWSTTQILTIDEPKWRHIEYQTKPGMRKLGSHFMRR